MDHDVEMTLQIEIIKVQEVLEVTQASLVSGRVEYRPQFS